jgi:hypothetical protein
MLSIEHKNFTIVATLALLLVAANAPAQQLDVRLNTEEAEAVLALVARGRDASPADWQRLHSSEGYRRLKDREAAMNRAFTDSAFRSFVLSPQLKERARALARTLEAWKTVKMEAAAARAFAYLPSNARIRATIYPSIKPRDNTFVWEPRTNPAIFFYLDPAMSAAQFDNTLAHELHHLGVASVCNNDRQPLPLQWMSGFAEGRAVLAAAGNPNVHPHETSPAAERATWDRDFQNVAEDMKRLEQFFTDLMSGALTEEEQNTRGFAMIASDSVPQGPFYTVGYHMARVVEMELGRARLIESLCDPLMFARDYNRVAAKQKLPMWSPAFIEKLARSSKP